MLNDCDGKLAWRRKHTHREMRGAMGCLEVSDVLAAEQPFQKIFTLFLEIRWFGRAFEETFNRALYFLLHLSLNLPGERFGVQCIRRILQSPRDHKRQS